MSNVMRFGAALFGVVFGCVSALGQRSTPVQVLHPAGSAIDQFGNAVAISGDTMIVGAPQDDVNSQSDQGSVHIYRWTGTGWAFEATLIGTDSTGLDRFGWSVGISGDTAVVGAYQDDGIPTDSGSAFIFVRTPGTNTWTQQAKLIASDASTTDQFGYSVAIAGNTVVIGANRDDVGANADQGSAYVFVRTGTTWTQQQKLTASDGLGADAMGNAVAISGDTIIAAASTDAFGAVAAQGSAYVFVRTGATWTQQQKLFAADGAAQDQFGFAVAISGDTALIGSYQDDIGANGNAGSAYVFTRSGTAWTQQAQLTASDNAANDFFGNAVALDGNTALIGAYQDDTGANANQGAAYVFVRSGTTWTQQTKLTGPDGAASDNFGSAVALAGDTAVIGVNNDDLGSNVNQGSAWVFSRIGSVWIGPDLKFVAADGSAFDSFGSSIAIATGSGGDTAVVGAKDDTVGANGAQGSAYVFTRSAGSTTWIQQAQLAATDGAATDRFGWSVAVDGDTAVVGAIDDDVGANAGQGSAYVFTRSGTTWTQQSKLVAADGAAADSFGCSVAISGDSVFVGAYLDQMSAGPYQGSVYVFTRSGTAWTQQQKLVSSDGATFDYFGWSIAVSGETAVIGAPSDSIGANVSQGSAYVFTRPGTTWTQQAKLLASDGGQSDSFGSSVAISGATILIGAELDTLGGNVYQGSVYVFTSSGTTWTQQAKLVAPDGAGEDRFGQTVALAGDTAVIGAYGDDGARGSAYVFTRAGTVWSQQAKLLAPDGVAPDKFGFRVSMSNRTILVGAIWDTVGANSYQGSVWSIDIADEDISLASNLSLQTNYSSLPAAFLPAQSGQQITATSAAWRGIGFLDTLGRSLGLSGTGAIRTPSTSILTLGGSSSLVVPTGSPIETFGQLLTSSGGSGYLLADSFLLGSRGILTARTNSSLTINAPVASLEGQTRLEQGSSLTFGGSATAIGSTTANLNSSLTTGGTFTNIDTFTMTAGTISAPLFWNRAATNIFGSSAMFGSFTNEAGAVTTIRSGTLFVFGSLTNNGTIVGTICSNCLSTPPNLDVTGSLAIGPAANLTMPFDGSLVHVGGNFDCAINSNGRYDMVLAMLQLEGTGSEQTLEVMSTDIGPDAAGLDRSVAGHYPIGVLHIGASPSTVRLVDARDNDGLGQGSCEAIYVNMLQIDAGSHLINPSCKIYYNTLVNGGVVDVPGNLVQIGGGCAADFDGDGFVTGVDFDLYVAAFENGDASADFDGDGFVTGVDFDLYVMAYEAGC